MRCSIYPCRNIVGLLWIALTLLVAGPSLAGKGMGKVSVDLDLSEAGVNRLVEYIYYNDELTTDWSHNLENVELGYSLGVGIVTGLWEGEELRLVFDASVHGELTGLDEFDWGGQLEARVPVVSRGGETVMDLYGVSIDKGVEGLAPWAIGALEAALVESLDGQPLQILPNFGTRAAETLRAVQASLWIERPNVDFRKTGNQVAVAMTFRARVEYRNDEDLVVFDLPSLPLEVSYSPRGDVQRGMIVADYDHLTILGKAVPAWLLRLAQEALDTDLRTLDLIPAQLFPAQKPEPELDLNISADINSIQLTDSAIEVGLTLNLSSAPPVFETRQLRPNPVDSHFMIDYSTSVETDLNWTLFSSAGERTGLEGKLRVSPGDHVLSVYGLDDRNYLASGYYYLMMVFSTSFVREAFNHTLVVLH